MLLNVTARRILDFMDDRVATSDDPRAVGKATSGPLAGYWRYRVGDHRIIRDIQDQRITALVVRIVDRQDVYR
jgi:mRNA interferase RelE/StbE